MRGGDKSAIMWKKEEGTRMGKKSFWVGLLAVILAMNFGASFPVKAAEPLHILALGDSIAQGYGLENPKEQSYSGILADKVGARVRNEGINGLKSIDCHSGGRYPGFYAGDQGCQEEFEGYGKRKDLAGTGRGRILPLYHEWRGNSGSAGEWSLENGDSSGRDYGRNTKMRCHICSQHGRGCHKRYGK